MGGFGAGDGRPMLALSPRTRDASSAPGGSTLGCPHSDRTRQSELEGEAMRYVGLFLAGFGISRIAAGCLDGVFLLVSGGLIVTVDVLAARGRSGK
jgi:hypothetical protein